MHKTAKYLSIAFLACVGLVAVSFPRIDVAVARYVYPYTDHINAIGGSFSGLRLLTAESTVVLVLLAVRLILGRLSPLGRAAILACLCSIAAYIFNAFVLKVCFGVPMPNDVLRGTTHAFNLFGGSPYSSFPSGHMTQAGAFAGVLMRADRRTILPLSVLLLFGAALLVIGNWHFVSDVIAGTFFGVVFGLLIATAMGQRYGIVPRATSAKE